MRIDTHDKSVEEKGARESLVSSTVQKSRKKGHLLRMQDRDLGSGFRGGYKLRNLQCEPKGNCQEINNMITR